MTGFAALSMRAPMPPISSQMMAMAVSAPISAPSAAFSAMKRSICQWSLRASSGVSFGLLIAPPAPLSQRHRVVLAPRTFHALGAQRGKGARDAAARGMGHNHLVDETALGRHEGIGEALFILGGARRDLLRI